jgi:hypothetical protein
MKYKLKEDYLSAKKDQEFFEFIGHNFGIVRDDTDLLGEECIAVSVEKNKNPFIVIPLSKLEKI